jgi:hypothetical protein
MLTNALVSSNIKSLMKSQAKSVKEYLQSLPPDRRETISAVREVILANLPKGYEERLTYGMIGYVVPHSLYPAGYHCDPTLPLGYACLGSQKNHIALHLMSAYGNPETTAWFQKAWKATGKKLDMGQACVRFKKLDDVPLSVIGAVIARTPVKDYIAAVEKTLAARKTKKK